MNDDIERRLRDSLQARAQDVEPTPELYARVEDKMNTNKRWTWIASAAGVAAAVVIGALVVPAILDDRVDGPDITDNPPSPSVDPTPDPTPTDEPGEPDPAATVPSHAVLAGDDRVWVVDTATGEEVAELINFASPENESDIIAVEVRPGSTLDDLTAVYVLRGEGTFTFGTVTFDGSEATNTTFPDQHQPSDDLVGDALPIPAFDPTGSHLAWVEARRGEENQSPYLRTIGWSDGPGTGEPATDNATFTLHAIPIEHPPSDFVVEDWIWTDEADGGRRGSLTVTGATEAWAVTIEEQADGALAMPGGDQAVRLLRHPDGVIIDRGHDGAEPDGIYVLVARGSDSQDAEDANFVLRRLTDSGSDEDLPVPDFIQTTAAPPDVWLNVAGDAYAVGLGARTRVYTPDASYEFDANYADFVR